MAVTQTAQSDSGTAAAKVVIADHNVGLRTALAIWLSCYGFEVVAEVGDIAGAVRALRSVQPDPLILDSGLVGYDDADMVAAVRSAGRTGVIVLESVLHANGERSPGLDAVVVSRTQGVGTLRRVMTELLARPSSSGTAGGSDQSQSEGTGVQVGNDTWSTPWWRTSRPRRESSGEHRLAVSSPAIRA